MSSGYSGTPLAKKLGIKEHAVVAALDAPAELREWLAPLPEAVRIRSSLGRSPDVVIAFVTKRGVLARRIDAAAPVIFPDAALWIAWPKRASGVPTDITEDTVRELALPLGLVDNKVCAINEVWSGLRVVWRRELRTR